jgi:hypothetical protein
MDTTSGFGEDDGGGEAMVHARGTSSSIESAREQAEFIASEQRQHYGLLDMSDLAPSYALPMVIRPMLLSVTDIVLGGLLFVYSVQRSTELEASVHYVAVLLVVFALYVMLTVVKEHLRAISSKPGFRRIELAQLLLRLLFLMLAFVSGLFVRMVSNRIMNAPSAGAFSLFDVIMPAAAITLVVCALHQISMAGEHRVDMVNAFARRRR